MLFVMYGRRLFSRVLAMTERSEMVPYEVAMFMYVRFYYVYYHTIICCQLLMWVDVVV